MYAFVKPAPEGGGKTNIAVVPAYKCPIKPEIYIHAELESDEGDRESEKVTLWVLFKGIPSYPWLKDITNFQFKIVDRIIEGKNIVSYVHTFSK